jgi:predicted dehydrogenase
MPDPHKIRVGFIGLSSKPDSWATLAHLPYLRRSTHFDIVALCNSSPEKARQSIAAHSLPPTTKTYASPAELAADEDIDLVVVCTRVDTHYTVALPALLSNNNNNNNNNNSPSAKPKAIFIEWPLAATTQQASELVSLAQASHVRTIIGLQARVSPTLLTIQQIISSGRLGAIHSVNVHATSGVWQHDIASARYEHFLKRDVGGNLLTIYGIHILDAVFTAVGELVPGSCSVAMGNLRPRMTVPTNHAEWSTPTEASPVEPASEPLGQVDKDTPDQIMLMGRLARPRPAPPAMLSFHLRAGSRARGAPGALWRIYGDKGELVVEFASAGPQIGQARKLEIHHFSMPETKAAEEVEEVLVDEGGEEWTSLPVSGQNIGRIYDAFAQGKEVPGWDVALKRHELIDEFWKAGGI